MRLFSPVVLLGLAASALGARNSGFLVKESVSLPIGWVQHSTPSPDHVISLRIGLPQPNFRTLERILYEVSDPDHARYGQHLSKAEVDDLVAPYPHSLNAVNDWLATHGLGEHNIDRSTAKDWIKITIPVRLVEEMLDTKYHVYQHAEDGDYLVRTTSYSLPEHLHEHIEVIQPTIMFGRFKPKKSNVVWLGKAPEQLEVSEVTSSTGQIYNIGGYHPTAKGNSIGITGYLGQFANFADLQTFYAEQVPAAKGSSFKEILINGGKNNQTLSAAGNEADLDVQYAFGLSHPIPGTFYSTGGSPPFTPSAITPTNTNEPYAEWLEYVMNHKDTPLVVSTSYGDNEQTVPQSYAKRVCSDLAQLGARGISLIFASGDDGVGDGDTDPKTQQCFTNHGQKKTRFVPSFPATCPYVTAVGATQHYPEEAVTRFFSGGGFSDYFPRPAYQAAAVQKYLDKFPKDLYKGLFNRAGRAFPDVSAQGDFFRVFVGGIPQLIGGTSASTPVVAAIVALLNDVRLKAGKPSLGFLNPSIYKATSGFNEVTVGNNGGCGTPGFSATAGWDPVTGVGTPNFGKLKALVMGY